MKLILYDRLLRDILPLLRYGRSGDAAHIMSAYRNAQRFFKKGEHNPRILFPAVLLHDIGFGLLRRSVMPLVSGGGKSLELTYSITAVSSAYAAWILPRYGFSPEEINAIRYCIEYGDEENLSVKSPPPEMVLLHDLNFLDRVYPHRVRVAKLRRSERELKTILDRSIDSILTPEIAIEARRRYSRVFK